MALPVIPNVFRVTWNFQAYQGITPRIVQHFVTSDANGEDVGEAIWDCTTNSMFSPMHTSFEPLSMDLLRLDGTSATITVNRTEGAAGGMCEASGQIIPAVAAIVSFQTLVRGPKARGRSFVGPVCESAVSDGVLDSTFITDMRTGWEGFLLNLAATDPNIAMCVASYTHESMTLVNSFDVKRILGTQRRRQNQLR